MDNIGKDHADRRLSDAERKGSEMRTRLRRIKLRDAALFVLVAGAVAVSTVCGAQELGLDGERADAGTETVQDQQAESQGAGEQEQAAEPLALTMIGPSRCITTHGQAYGTDVAIYDVEGNYLRTERRFSSYRGVKAFQVSWTVSGGTGPYTLTIDGASEDHSGPFTGASGRGMVFCADTDVASFVDEWGSRGYRGVSMLDSGWKTVQATVTDADGRTSSASIEVYVIIDGHGPVLKRGKTYRISGHLFTIPAGFDMKYGNHSTGGPGSQEFIIAGTDPPVLIELWDDNLMEADREVPAQRTGASGSADNQAAQHRRLHAALDSFANSLDQPPAGAGN